MNWMVRGKKIISTVVVGSMMGLITISFAAEGGNTVTVQTLFASGRTGLSATVDQLTVRAGESTLIDALLEADKTYVNGTDEDNINKRIKKELDPVIAQDKLDAAKLDEAQNALEREASIQKAYDELMLEQKKLGAIQKKLEYAKEELALAKAKLSAGLIAPIDLADTEYAVTAADLDVAVQMTLVAEKELNLLNSAELDVSSPLALTDAALTLMPTAFADDVTVETLLPLAKARDSSLFMKQKDVLAAEKRLSYATVFYKAGAKVYDKYYLDLEITNRDLADALRDIEVKVANALADVQIAKESMKLATSYVKLMQKNLAQATDRQKAGLAARSEMIAAERQLLDAQIAEWTEIVSYNSKEVALRLLVGEQMQPQATPVP